MKAVRSATIAPTVLLLAAMVAGLSAHLKVERTSPADNTSVTERPEQLRVWFSQAPTLAISSLVLEGPAGKVAVGKVVAGQTDGKADHSLVAPITGAMTAGPYTVTWKTSGPDGHIQTGTFQFTYAPED